MIRTIIAMALSVGVLLGAPVASAGPNMSCSAAVDWRNNHDAMPHKFSLPSQQAAYDAYNAEADAIDAQIRTSCG